MIVVTGIVGWLAVRGRAHRRLLVGLDLAVTVALTLASVWAQTPVERFSTGMPTLTTLWAAGPVIEVAYLFSWMGGVVAALVQFGAAVIVRDGYDGRTLTSGVLLLTVGAVTGYVATLVVRAENELAEAVATRVGRRGTRTAGALDPRRRACRSLPSSTGAASEAGGEWAVLAAVGGRAGDRLAPPGHVAAGARARSGSAISPTPFARSAARG